MFFGNMIKRDITPCLVRLFKQYPFVTLTGPRQSGKTTLCRETFPHLKYVNLEDPNRREFAQSDPLSFLSQLEGGAILDEIQRVPELLSYLQVLADEKRENSLFVLTGSENLALSQSVSQSLAGRTALLYLLPFSLPELQRTGADNSIDHMLYSGFYPRIHDQELDPQQVLGDYFETYVERDVRRITEIRNLSAFRSFVRLCAGRVGQLVNTVSLGSDAGVSHATAKQWLTLLEASYILFQLQPFHANIRKRLVKSPKLYFYDVGLARYLLGIERPEQIATHSSRGALFENAVVVETLKYRFNQGHRSNLYFFRDSKGLECDLLFETGHGMGAIEIKAGATIASDYFDSLDRVSELIPEISTKAVVYGGTTYQPRSTGQIVPFADLYSVLERFEVKQEMAAFVEEKAGPPAPDVNVLDNVYNTHILPILSELESPIERDAAKLFDRFWSSSSVAAGSDGEFIQDDLLKAVNWEQTKKKHIVKPDFRINNVRKLKLAHRYHFNGYIGKGENSFDLYLCIIWTLDSEGFSREVSINSAPIPNLGDRVKYSELNDRSAKVNYTVGGICRKIREEIENRSSI